MIVGTPHYVSTGVLEAAGAPICSRSGVLTRCSRTPGVPGQSVAQIFTPSSVRGPQLGVGRSRRREGPKRATGRSGAATPGDGDRSERALLLADRRAACAPAAQRLLVLPNARPDADGVLAFSLPRHLELAVGSIRSWCASSMAARA
jgi:hypothetical protein